MILLSESSSYYPTLWQVSYFHFSQAQAMKEQARLREEMAYQYKLGNFEVGINVNKVFLRFHLDVHSQAVPKFLLHFIIGCSCHSTKIGPRCGPVRELKEEALFCLIISSLVLHGSALENCSSRMSCLNFQTKGSSPQSNHFCQPL